MPTLAIEIDRTAAAPVGEQIYASLRQAIVDGRLQPGRRLPSGRDLAAQLGVARGTILVAYERLASEKLVVGAGSAGTRVCAQLPPAPTGTEIPLDGPLDAFTRPYSSAPLPFQMGVPAHDAFPAKVWARMRARLARTDCQSPGHQPTDSMPSRSSYCDQWIPSGTDAYTDRAPSSRSHRVDRRTGLSARKESSGAGGAYGCPHLRRCRRITCRGRNRSCSACRVSAGYARPTCAAGRRPLADEKTYPARMG